MKAALFGAVLALVVPFRASSAQSLLTSSTSSLSGTTQAQQSMSGFGQAVAIGQEWAFVGEPEPRLHSQNAVFVYRLAGDEWVASDTLSSANPGDLFGAAVELDGNRLFVGAPNSSGTGAVYVYELEGSAWTQAHLLQASSHVQGAGFGTALDANDTLLVVGAPYEDGNNGAAYIFERQEDDAWLMVNAVAGSRQDGGLFGFAVAAASARVAVGAQYSDDRAGVVYSFARDESTGTYLLDEEIVGSETIAGHRFGRSMAAVGDRLIVGAPAYLGDAGIVYEYTFDEQSGTWIETDVIGRDAPLRYFFGWSVAAESNVLAVGGLSSYIAHIFTRADSSADYLLDALLGENEVLGVWSLGATEGRTIVGSRDLESVVVFADTEAGWEVDARLRGGTYGLERIEGLVECSGGLAADFPCDNVDLLSFVPFHQLGTDETKRLNDIWGWTDPESGVEYALVGRTDGTSFVDLSDPEHPLLIGSLPATADASPWRDIKVIADHAVIVADNAGDHGMQVFDLTQLRSVTDPPVVFEPTALYDRIGSAHNVVTNEEASQAYIVGATGAQNVPTGFNCGPGPHIVDMSDPSNPTFAGCYNPSHGRGYTHDAQCLRYNGPDADYSGKDLCFGADEVGISITDVTDPVDPMEISLAAYPNASYTHQGWLSADGRYFLVDDETDETNGLAPRTRTMVYDVVDLDEPVFVGEYLGPTSASDHNLYVRDNLLYEANYRAGLRILDLGSGDLTPDAFEEIAYFDVYPPNDDAGFDGSWSSYPYFASGIVIVSGIESGLFVLSPRLSSNIAREEPPKRLSETRLRAFPNPTNGTTTLAISIEQGGNVRIELFDALGRSVRLIHDGYLSAGAQTLSLESVGLPTGTYFVHAVGEGVKATTTVTIRR